MGHGSVAELVARGKRGDQRVGILHIPLTVQFSQTHAQPAQIGIGKERRVSCNQQTVGDRLGCFANGFTRKRHDAKHQLALHAVVDTRGHRVGLRKDQQCG